MNKDYTKIGIAIALSIFLLFLIVQIVKFSGRRQIARQDYENSKKEYEAALADGEKIKADLNYYSNPDNLSKEMRARFNYALPGEKILILIQEKASSTADSSQGN